MSRRSVSALILLPAVFFFIAGWSSYEWIINFVVTETTHSISAASPDKIFSHRITLTLSFALMGAFTGISTLLAGRLSDRIRYGLMFSVLFILALITSACWILVLAGRTEAITGTSIPSSTLTEITLPLSAIPLYEIGIFGAGSTLVAAIFLSRLLPSLFMKQTSGKNATPS
jgi:hypothetical protein